MLKITLFLIYFTLSVSLGLRFNHLPRLKHFEDYLQSLDQVIEVEVNEKLDEEENNEGSGGPVTLKESTYTTPSRHVTDEGDILPVEVEEEAEEEAKEVDEDRDQTQQKRKHVKELTDRETTCCILGQLAADKGYHCHVKFYSNRVILRNRNRAHNRKMSFHGRDKVAHYGEKIMYKFEKCLAGKGFIFHKCCHISAQEKRKEPHYNSYLKYLNYPKRSEAQS